MWGQLASMSASHCPGSSASGQRLTVRSWACCPRLLVDCLRSLRRAAGKKGWNRREIITVRGQSYVSRLPKYWSPTRRVCTPRLCWGGRTHSPGEEGDGGSIFWKTRDIGLPSYSNNLSTVEMIMQEPNLKKNMVYGTLCRSWL
jgi:hypothetical protein